MVEIMKIGFIGVGNMAKAIIEGLMSKGVEAKNIFIHSAHKSNYEVYSQETGVSACESNSEVIEKSDVVFLAVKPIVVEKVLKEVKDSVLTHNPVLVSVVTGVSVAELEDTLGGKDVKIVRTMPNVNVEIGEGMTALHKNDNVSDEDYQLVRELFEKIGKVAEIEEKDFSTFVALAGSSPAFVYFFIDSLARSGVKYGLNKQKATQIAAQAVLGSALKVLKSDKTPWELVDDVSSPGGTTVAGLLAMEEAGFMTSIVKGVDATISKDKG